MLYRYFTDKNDLRLAMAARIFESTILPRLTSAITDDADEYSLTRTVIEVYVTSVADEPNLYRFALTSQSGDAMISADSEKLIIELITVLITMRLTERAPTSRASGVGARAGRVDHPFGRLVDGRGRRFGRRGDRLSDDVRVEFDRGHRRRQRIT